MKVTFEIRFQIIDNAIKNSIENEFQGVERESLFIINEIVDKIEKEFGTKLDEMNRVCEYRYESFFDLKANTEKELDEIQKKGGLFLHELKKKYQEKINIGYYISDWDFDENNGD